MVHIVAEWSGIHSHGILSGVSSRPLLPADKMLPCHCLALGQDLGERALHGKREQCRSLPGVFLVPSLVAVPQSQGEGQTPFPFAWLWIGWTLRAHLGLLLGSHPGSGLLPGHHVGVSAFF